MVNNKPKKVDDNFCVLREFQGGIFVQAIIIFWGHNSIWYISLCHPVTVKKQNYFLLQKYSFLCMLKTKTVFEYFYFSREHSQTRRHRKSNNLSKFDLFF